jgi:RNA-binding protein
MLSSKQRGRLSGLAQNMDCLITLGRSGATPELADRLKELLERHELVKLRFGDFKESRVDLAAALAESTGSEVVRMIGCTAIFWKTNPDREGGSFFKSAFSGGGI